MTVPTEYFGRLSDQSMDERTNKLNKFNDLEFLEKHKLPKLTQNEKDKLNSSITIKGTESIIKTFLQT